MAVNIDFSAIENSTRTDVPRTQPPAGSKKPDDIVVDVLDESEIAAASPLASNSSPLISRRDQLSLFSVLLVLSIVSLFGHVLGKSGTERPHRLSGYQVDLNSAGLEELVLLEGIGEVTAEKILLERETSGPFPATDDLQRVKGIGPKTVERLRDHVVCR